MVTTVTVKEFLMPCGTDNEISTLSEKASFATWKGGIKISRGTAELNSTWSARGGDSGSEKVQQKGMIG